MLTPVFDFSQHQQDDSHTDDKNDSVEAAMYAYLHEQPHSLDSPLPASSMYTISSPSSSSSSYLASSPSLQIFDNYTSDSDSLRAINNCNLFQSPQLLDQDLHPMLKESENSLYCTPITFSQQQEPPSSMSFGPWGWGYPLLDMLKETTNMNNTLYANNSTNNQLTIDPSLMELLGKITSGNYNASNNTAVTNETSTDNQRINMNINSFTDLLHAIERMKTQVNPSTSALDEIQPRHQPRRPYKKRKSRHSTSSQSPPAISLVQQQNQQQTTPISMTMMKKLPAVIHDTVDTFLPTLMDKAQSHWCCVGFKVAPVTLDMIRNWRQAPVTIVYCVASIALVTFLDHNAGQAYIKAAAMEFYEQARRKMDDIVFDDENDISNYNNGETDDDDDYDPKGNFTESGRQKAMTIQSYFCLSYTSNLLRLYEQQRTWGGLASIALQLRTKDVETGCRPMDQAILLCYCRWYYVDAWMSLTLGRDCLLPDTPPRFLLDAMQPQQRDPLTTQTTMTTTIIPHEHQSLYQFVKLTKFMRRYIQVIQSGKLVDPVTKKPSSYYYETTTELKQWYSMIQQEEENNKAHTNDFEHGDSGGGGGVGRVNAHLHICYNAMRLVVLYKLLHPDLAPPDDWTLMDGLDTNLALLLSLQQLASQHCDQSTYHYIYYAIHNTSARIYQYHTKNRNSKWQKWARQQLQINLVLLKGTQAYVNDVFQMRVYAEKIEQQFLQMGLQLLVPYQSILLSMEQQQALLQQQQQQQRKYVTTNQMGDGDPGRHKQQPYGNGVVSPAATITTKTANHDHELEKKKEHQAIDNLKLTHRSPALSPSPTSPTTVATTTIATTPSSTTTGILPGMHIYKLHTAASIKKPRKTVKIKQTKQ